MNEPLLQQAKALLPELQTIRRRLHRMPEPARKEFRTAETIAEVLNGIPGLTVRKNVFATGILADLQGALPGPVVVLRADMDALNIAEETGLPCASETPGMMHACGHDFHMTMLLGAAMLLAARRNELRGTVRFMFQPSEEYLPEGGSRGMIDAGALDGAAAVFGLHVWPDLPFGKVGIKAGALMACDDHFVIHLQGKSAHAGRPDQGTDALQAGCRLATALQSIISRNVSPMENAVVSIGKIQAGVRYNIVPAACVLEGTVRSLNPEVRDTIQKRLGEMVQGEAMASGCEAELDYRRGYCAVINDAAMSKYAGSCAGALLGEQNVVAVEHPTMIGEDFGFYLEKVPGCFFWLGTAQENAPFYPLHSSRFAPDENLLPIGAALMSSLALRFGEMNHDECYGK